MKWRELRYFGLTILVLVMLFEMWIYGWNESLFICSFPFNQVQPLRIHYITILVCVALMGINLNFYRNVEFWRRITLSALLVLLGLSGFELIWHIGRGFDYGIGPSFWLFYLLMVFLCFIYLQWRWAKRKIPIRHALLYLALLFGFLVFWLYYAKVFDFYPALLLYDAHLGPNPHTIGFFMFKSAVLFSPLLLVRRDDK